MKADTWELRQILVLERRYLIPTYQRDYEWTEDGQWSLLFDDLEAAAERLAREREHRAATRAGRMDQAVTPHFLGAVVVDQLPSPAGGIDIRAVIDGQQRLTTLLLLLRGLLDALMAAGADAKARQVRRLLENPDDVITDPLEIHKLWPRLRDRQAWTLAMADPEPAGPHVYFDARRYFATRARSALEDPQAQMGTDDLVDAALDLFKIVVIDLEPNDDAQVIFEVLNGRQTPLSAADLVKNLLFLRAEFEREEELDRYYNDYWAQFDDEWWKQEIGRGHAARRHTDMLLAAWLTIITGEEASPQRLYGQIRRYIDSDQRKVTELLPELREMARHYRVIRGVEREQNPRISTAYARLTKLDVTTTIPLLLWLRSLNPGRLSAPDHERAVVAVESFVMRRLLIGGQTRGYGQVFGEVLEQAKEEEQREQPEIASAIERALLSAPQNRSWPTSEEVEEEFVRRRMYGVDSQMRIRMILGAIDAHLRSQDPRAEPGQFDYDSLTIEHVMPQAWQRHWSVSAATEAERELTAQERDAAINRIGNLTLVTRVFNPVLSNGPWRVKRAALREHSSLKITSDIVSSDSWDETAIESRARALAKYACQVWPHPDQTYP